MSTQKEQYLNIKSMAKMLDTTEAAIRQRVKRGTLPYYKLGKRILFSRSEVIASMR